MAALKRAKLQPHREPLAHKETLNIIEEMNQLIAAEETRKNPDQRKLKEETKQILRQNIQAFECAVWAIKISRRTEL